MLTIRQIADRAAINSFERDGACISDMKREGRELCLTFLCKADLGPCPKPCYFVTETMRLDCSTPRDAARAMMRLQNIPQNPQA